MNVTNSAGSCPAILADGASIHRAKPTGPLSRPDRIGTSSFPIAGPLQNFLSDDRFWPLRVTPRYDRSCFRNCPIPNTHLRRHVIVPTIILRPTSRVLLERDRPNAKVGCVSPFITTCIACTAPLAAPRRRDRPARHRHRPRVLLFTNMLGRNIVAVCFTRRFQPEYEFASDIVGIWWQPADSHACCAVTSVLTPGACPDHCLSYCSCRPRSDNRRMEPSPAPLALHRAYRRPCALPARPTSNRLVRACTPHLRSSSRLQRLGA